MENNTIVVDCESVAVEIAQIADAMLLVIDNYNFGQQMQFNALISFIDHLNRVADDLRQEGLKQP